MHSKNSSVIQPLGEINEESILEKEMQKKTLIFKAFPKYF